MIGELRASIERLEQAQIDIHTANLGYRNGNTYVTDDRYPAELGLPNFSLITNENNQSWVRALSTDAIEEGLVIQEARSKLLLPSDVRRIGRYGLALGFKAYSDKELAEFTVNSTITLLGDEGEIPLENTLITGDRAIEMNTWLLNEFAGRAEEQIEAIKNQPPTGNVISFDFGKER